ncbi:hypothetical protein HS041_12285 [Planomonospora sp. ID67723]|uniref:hypothetical protein n=1 Tax=Planomonospora sp. ID67723 TaxID=2738134 RepID=UPI0018C3CB13|nr:hypothetical protein [Planomonospora sp. ID67723]MBG0828547.1 hypothetical protein [Planomonospora sp. ID67723]
MSLIDLPVHPFTGLTALGLRRNGDPIWPILGGSEDADDVEETEETESEDTETSEEPDDEDKPLGPAGEKALQAEKDKRKAAAEKARVEKARADAAEAELAKLRRAAERAKPKAADKDADEAPDPEEIRREAEQSALARANERIIRAEIRAAAAGKLNDPRDALSFLDLSKFEVDADGNVDADEVADAIEDLLKNKPYLAVPAQGDGKRFKGSGDGGAKPSKPTRPKSLSEAVTKALSPS